MADNKQRELEASDNTENDRLLKLEEELREVIAAEQFFEQASGKLFVKVATEQINKVLKDITSDKYRKDLVGYNNALSKLDAYKDMLRRMQVAASPQRKSKINEKMNEDNDGTE